MAKDKKKLEWRSESMKVADLVPADYNPRKLSDKARADLTESVREFGQVEPIVVNADGTIIGGHQRATIYADLGMEVATVMRPSRPLDKAEEKRLNLRLNKNLGEWDAAKLKEFFGLKDLLGVGFEQAELKVWFGLEDAGDMEVDEARMTILAVYPPEAPKLKERVAVHFDDLAEYARVKKAVAEGRLTAADILRLI